MPGGRVTADAMALMDTFIVNQETDWRRADFNAGCSKGQNVTNSLTSWSPSKPRLPHEGLAMKAWRGQYQYPVPLMAHVIEVSSAGFYAWLKRPPSQRAQEAERLRVAVLATHRKTRETYGTKRLLEELREVGWNLGRDRLACIRKELGIRWRQWRRSGQDPDRLSVHDHRFPATVHSVRSQHRPDQAPVHLVHHLRPRRPGDHLRLEPPTRRVLKHPRPRPRRHLARQPAPAYSTVSPRSAVLHAAVRIVQILGYSALAPKTTLPLLIAA